MTFHSVATGFGFRGNNIVRKHAWVPLTTTPIPLSSTATLNEPGGIGIYGRLP
jgi:hypothetical protein